MGNVFMLPSADQIEAVSQIPVITMAMVVVFMALFILIPVVRGLYSKQRAQEDNSKALLALITNRDEQIERLTTAFSEQWESYKAMVIPILNQLTTNELGRKAVYDDIHQVRLEGEQRAQMMIELQKAFNARLDSIETCVTRTSLTVDKLQEHNLST